MNGIFKWFVLDIIRVVLFGNVIYVHNDIIFIHSRYFKKKKKKKIVKIVTWQMKLDIFGQVVIFRYVFNKIFVESIAW